MRSSHEPTTFENYLTIHERYLRNFEHFIVRNTLAYRVTSTLVYWRGALYCADGFELHVYKSQLLDRGVVPPTVETVRYRYQALRRNASGEAISLFRYDNVHQQPGHADNHHRHTFDAAGNEIEPPGHTGRAGWPTFSQVIEELYGLWEQWKASHRP